MILILEPDILIEKIKDKGIKFDLYTEEDAKKFLNYNNYYVKLTAYRTNFHKHNGKYVGLDFKALVDLSTIDMYLKQSILKSCLCIEHSLKVNVLKDIQEKSLDDFELTEKYLNQYPRIKGEIAERRNKSYVKNLLLKYTHPIYPIWIFLEVIPFGEFVNFYRFYCENYGFDSLNYSILYSVKDIRNAAAHNNCIIHNLKDKTGYYKQEIVDSVHARTHELRKGIIQDRLKNESVQDFVAMIIALDELIKSKQIKLNLLKDFYNLFNVRMIRDKNIYKSAPAIQQSYDFCKIILDTLEPRPYNNSTN